MALGVLRQIRLVVHPYSILDAERQARHLSKFQRGQRRSLDCPKSPNVVSSGIAFTALDLIARPSPFRGTMRSSVRKRFPSHVPKCQLSVMAPPGTFPATLHITATPNGKNTPRCFRLFDRSYADLPSLATWHSFRMSVACSTIHGNTGEWTEIRLPTRLER